MAPMRTVLVMGIFILTACGWRVPSPPDAAASLVRLGGVVCRDDLFAGGVFIDASLVLTAAHPVAGSLEGVIVETLDGRTGTGVVVGFDPDRDLALLDVQGLAGDRLELAEATADDTGSIWTIDRDLELKLVDYTVDRLITATGDDIYGDGDVSRRALQLSAEISPGMSGSPVLNQSGRILGLVFAESRDTVTSYAVASSEIEAFLAETDPLTPVTPGRCP